MLKIGHRGARGHKPENTLLGFEKAISFHVDQIELDVHLSKDGEIVVIHDETIDRTTNGTGNVNELTLLQIQNFCIEGEQIIPTLTQVLDLIADKCDINIEIKSFESTEKVVRLIEEYVSNKNWKYSRFLVSSFDWKALEKVNDLNSAIPIGVLTEEDLDEAVVFAKNIKAKSINPDFHLLTKENVLEIQNQGFEVFTWTVNEMEDIERMKTFKVDGIISDYPDRL
ncbi:glycerophosphodiester phosphodiesterase [Flavobacterium algicola]|uniref:glycerophosphodiester phosphodiesterase n=1 Tax=Flavobacterium algicola TaxID=556529 RepID=UPI001EFCB6DE|nr:glycerophosphodiester phosphodiesterase family protein [Flavobacterium algicola]MCG9794095.1 glycerophosphodiester phosphodiesterase [Flavobacterium algicola]